VPLQIDTIDIKIDINQSVISSFAKSISQMLARKLSVKENSNYTVTVSSRGTEHVITLTKEIDGSTEQVVLSTNGVIPVIREGQPSTNSNVAIILDKIIHDEWTKYVQRSVSVNI